MNNLEPLKTFAKNAKNTDRKLPVIFIGHGNPMNALGNNEYYEAWQHLGENLPRPQAILCVSAHWETLGTMVTAMDKPKTIHDFYGFPKKLFDVEYPAPGSPEFATLTQKTVKSFPISDDFDWGIDHGTWSVIKPMFPKADIPVFQLSLDRLKSPSLHFELAKELKMLRNKGVLIVGSGNIVHNLRTADLSTDAGYDWAIEFDEKVKDLINKNDLKSLVDYQNLGNIANMSIPTNEHYLPLLYILAVKENVEQPEFFTEKVTAGSLSMRSVIFG